MVMHTYSIFKESIEHILCSYTKAAGAVTFCMYRDDDDNIKIVFLNVYGFTLCCYDL